jgi:hypothetical protein
MGEVDNAAREKDVDDFKNGVLAAIAGVIGAREGARGEECAVYVGARFGDQLWDVGTLEAFEDMPSDIQRRMEDGHHILALEGGGVGLKIDGDRLEDDADLARLAKAVVRLRRGLLDHARGRAEPRAIVIVGFDIDDTLIHDVGDVTTPVAPVAQFLADIVTTPSIRELAGVWGEPADGLPDHNIEPYLITARYYSVDQVTDCLTELYKAGIVVPPGQCLYLKPAAPWDD